MTDEDSHIAVKTQRCSSCQHPINEGERYWLIPGKGRKKTCLNCKEGKPSPPANGVEIDGIPYPPEDMETGFGRTRAEATENFKQLNNEDLEMIRVRDLCAIIPDEITREMIIEQVRIAKHAGRQPSWDTGARAWIVSPDNPSRQKAQSNILAYKIGQPIQRILNKHETAETEEQRLKRCLMNEDTMRIYADYGVYAGKPLTELVRACGGNPDLIPKPKLSFK